MAEDTVKSAARVISILSYFQEVREPRSLKAICEDLGYPQSSTTVLLKTLTVMGYLNYDRVGRVYFPTIKVASLGDWVAAALFGRGEVLDLLRDLWRSTGEAIVLATRNDIYIQYIATIESSHEIRFHVEQGSMRLMTDSPLGWLLMSTFNNKEVDNIIRRSNIIKGEVTSLNISETTNNIISARERCLAYGENIPFVGGATLGISLPIKVNGQPVVIGCGGVLERMRANRNRYIELMEEGLLNLKAQAMA